MKTRRTIKGTSVGGVVEEAYTPSNPPPYPVVEDGSYLTLGAGYLATQMKITATSSAEVGWYKFAEVQYKAADLNNTYSAILLVNGVNSSQYAETQSSKSESGEIEIDFYKAVNDYPIQIAISVLSGNINANELCAVLDTANSKISLYTYLNQYQSTAWSLLSEEQTYPAQEYSAKLVFVKEYYGATAPYGAIYAVVRNNASELNGKAVSDIFESDGVTAKKATNVTTNINGKALSSIFESNGTTVKNATKATQDASGNVITSTYATKSELNSGLSGKANTSGSYPNLTVGKATNSDNATNADNSTNATNIIPDENSAINPGGRKADRVVGRYSTALGSNASASGSNSTALGSNASASGEHSIALGNSAGTSGEYSIALGNIARASGDSSTALGRSTSAVGNYSTALGYYASASGSNSTALGEYASVSSTDSNTMQLGADGLSALNCAVNLNDPSDKRDKTDIVNITDALAFIERLNPVTFVRNARTKYISDEDKKSETFRKYGMCEYDRVSHAAGTKKGKRRRCGLLAQEVVAAMQEVYGTDNYANIVNDNFHDLQEKPSDVENKYTLAYSNLVPFLIGAIKELNAEIKILKDKLNDNN